MNFKIYIIIFIFVFSLENSYSCSCNDSTVDLPIAEMGLSDGTLKATPSEIIFDGVLLRAEKDTSAAKTRLNLFFYIKKYYKGKGKDTLLIRTNYGSDACGFMAPPGTDCLIFSAKNKAGQFTTWRSDCCKSISKALENKRYLKYINFLEVIEHKTDGDYFYEQSKTYWKRGMTNADENVPALRFKIINGQMEGDWEVYNRKGDIVEKGQYERGEKVKTWFYYSGYINDLAQPASVVKKIKYKKGKLKRTKTYIKTIDLEKNIYFVEIYKNGKYRRKKRARSIDVS